MALSELAADALHRWWPTKWSEHQRRRWFTVGVFSLVTGLLFADQNLLAPNLSEAADSFGFTDLQRDQYLGGVISAAFFIVGAPASILAGYLMDRHNRVHLLIGCVVLGEAPCLATLFVTRFWQLLLTRLLTGIAVGGAAPIIYGLLSDLFTPQERAYVTTCVVLSQGAGVSLGNVVAGGFPGLDWRTPFVIVSVPTMIVTIIMGLTTEDPLRGGAEPALQHSIAAGLAYDEHQTLEKFAKLCKTRTNILVILQGLPGCLPWGVVIAFLNDFLQSEGLSKQAATLVVMAFGSGGILGSIIAGVGGQALYNRRKGALPVFAGLSVWAGMPLLLAMINWKLAVALPMLVLLPILFLGGTVASIAGVIIRPLIMNVNLPETRGIALAFQATLDDVGKGLGPALVAGLISLTGRVTAFNIAIAGWIPCGLLLLLAGLSISEDEARVQSTLSEVAATRHQVNDLFLGAGAAPGLSTPAVSLTTDEGCTPKGLIAAALEPAHHGKHGLESEAPKCALELCTLPEGGESAPLLGADDRFRR